MAEIDAFSGQSSPTIFPVYAHDRDTELTPGQLRIHAYSETVKLFIQWLHRTRTRTVSDQYPMPLFEYPARARGLNACGDILDNQFCLLPLTGNIGQTGSETVSVDKVIVCGSPLLESYRRDHFAKRYICAIYTVYEHCQNLGNETLRTALLQKVVTPASKYPSFHHVLTELAFLGIRQQRNSTDHGIVLVSLGGGMMDYLEFPELTNLRLEVQSLAAVEDLHSRFFKLLRLIFTNKNAIIGAFENAYNQTRACLERTTQEMSRAQISRLVDSSLAQTRSQLRAQENSELRDLSQRKRTQASRMISEGLERDRDSLLGTLPTVPYRDRKDRNTVRVADTCLWFTKHPKFLRWRAGRASPLLWVTALPGCGKSVLLRYLIDDILAVPGDTICYFFFKDDSEAQRSAKGALRCMLHQLLLQHRTLLSEDLLQRFARDRQVIESLGDLWSVLLDVSAKIPKGKVLFVIDALDECGEEETAHLVNHLVHWNEHKGPSNRLKILISSRLYTNIRRGFTDAATQIHLSGETDQEIEQISREIDLVIDARLSSIASRLQLTDEHCSIVKGALGNVPQKTYLWANLVLDEIGKDIEANSKSLQSIITTLPKTLDEAYEKILKRGGRPERVKRMLSILLAVREPLNLQQLSEIWAVEVETTSCREMDIKPEKQMSDLLMGLCGLFVIISNRKVHFLHQTARAFLLRSQSEMTRKPTTADVWRGSIVHLDTHIDLVRSLMRYLGFSDLSPLSAVETLSPGGRRDMTYYASKHLFEHLKEAANQLEPLDLKLYAVLWKDSTRGVSQYFLESGRPLPRHPCDASSLIMAAWLGAVHLVRWLLDNEYVIVDEMDPEYHRTALYWAISGGHIQVVQLLMERGADSTLPCSRGMTPLAFACFQGQKDMATVLLRFDHRSVNMVDHRGDTPLYHAISRRHHDIALELLNHGANPRLSNVLSAVLKCIANCASARASYTAILGVILARGVEVNKKDRSGRTGLDRVVLSGQFEIIPLLLQYGAVTESLSGSLALAALQGRTEVLRLSIDEDASIIRVPHPDRMSLLAFAAIGGCVEAVRYLMEIGGRNDGPWAKYELIGSGHPRAMQLLEDETLRLMASRASQST